MEEKVAGTLVPASIAPTVRRSFQSAAVVSLLYLLYSVLAVVANSSNITQLLFYLLFGVFVPLCGWCGAKHRKSLLVELFTYFQGFTAGCSIVLLIVLWIGIGAARAPCKESECVAAFASGNTTCHFDTANERSGGAIGGKPVVGRGMRVASAAVGAKQGAINKEFCESGHDWFVIVGTILLLVHIILAIVATIFACHMKQETKEVFSVERVEPTPQRKGGEAELSNKSNTTVVLATATIIDENSETYA